MENQIIEKSNNLAEVTVGYKNKIKPSEQYEIKNSLDVADYLRGVFSEDKIEHVEEFVVLLMSTANKILGWAKISTGGVASCIVDSKVVFQLALNANASAIIISHNHPSGNLKPSEQDIRLTKKLMEGGKILDIAILDHIIMTAESYFSLGDSGLM